MSDEDILAMLSSKTFLCPSCSKFGEIDRKNTDEKEEGKTTVGDENLMQ